MAQFRGSAITSDAGLLPYRELDNALGLTETGANTLADARTGKNGRHRLAGLLRQSVFGRLAGYEDVNDAERLSRDPGDALGGWEGRCADVNTMGSHQSSVNTATAPMTCPPKTSPPRYLPSQVKFLTFKTISKCISKN